MEPIDALGYCAGIVAVISLFPQVRQSWRTRSTGDINLTAFAVLTLGNFLWLLYGALLGSIPLMVANFITGSMVGSIVYLKLRYR